MELPENPCRPLRRASSVLDYRQPSLQALSIANPNRELQYPVPHLGDHPSLKGLIFVVPESNNARIPESQIPRLPDFQSPGVRACVTLELWEYSVRGLGILVLGDFSGNRRKTKKNNRKTKKTIKNVRKTGRKVTKTRKKYFGPSRFEVSRILGL